MAITLSYRASSSSALFLLLRLCSLWSILILEARCDASPDSEAGLCPHPGVPAGARYVNITGGAGTNAWKIKYICDTGYEMFGESERECEDGKWEKTDPVCAVNVARYKPAFASSVSGGGEPERGVDGVVSTVHEGKRCTETNEEQSPWWAVDLLTVKPVKHVRITTRCCDDLPVKNLEIRVGNSTTYKDNPLCNWIPGTLPQGETKTVDCAGGDARGRYVSLSMTGGTGVLSLCEVEVFSVDAKATASCSQSVSENELSVFGDSCYWLAGSAKDNLGYVDANKACEKIGYSLLNNVDLNTVTFVRSRIEADNKVDRGGILVWLGAERDLKLGGDVWTWTATGDRVNDIFWGKEQPNNYANEQNCAVLDSELDWKWNDISCKVDAKTICRGNSDRCSSPAVSEGTWVSGERSIGEAVTYSCPLGYKSEGLEVQKCLPGGHWEGEPITCKYVDCGDVPGLLNGAIHVLDGRTTYGARIKYECNEDYSLIEGDKERVCTEDGWNGTAPRCEFTRCPELETVPNSEIKQIPSSAGPNRLASKAIYTCNPGHVASGSLSRECQLGGTWSGSPPSCEFVDCGEPPDVANGKLEQLDGRTTYGARVRYSCSEDYNIVGDTERRCEANGRWSKAITECRIIKCPTPRAPTGGRVSGYNYEVHRKVEYSCLDGHRLEGDPVLQCERSGQWSVPPPRCRYVDCGQLKRLKGGLASLINGTTHLHSHVRFSCGKSHSLVGPETMICQESGEWTDLEGKVGVEVSCEEIRCSLPLRPNNTVVSISSTERLHGTSVIRTKLDTMANTYKVGSQLKYRCERGYLLKGGERVANRRCTTDGTWTGEAPECEYVDCGNPDPVDNGNFALQNNGTTYYGSMVFYTCNTGWKLQGFEKRSCQASGRWEPDAPSCLETLCSEPKAPEHGHMNITTLRIGGQATFACDHGYKVVGDEDIECLSSGSWSGWPPACVEIDCGQPPKVDNANIFLVQESTKYGSVVEYVCEPGYKLDGPQRRECELTSYWSGREPTCSLPRRVPNLPARTNTRPVVNNDIDDNLFYNSLEGEGDGDESGGGRVGVWIGVALGLIVLIGLVIVAIYFYKKQQLLPRKQHPARDNNANGLGILGIPSYANNTNAIQPTFPGSRPPPPIQMYSMEDTEDHRGPIYDTINDGDSGHSTYSHNGSSVNGGGTGSSHLGGAGAGSPVEAVNGGVAANGHGPLGARGSTFVAPPVPPSINGMQNPAFSRAGESGVGLGHHSNSNSPQHDYDVPEGGGPPTASGRPSSNGSASPVGTVTINGIAV